MKPFYWTGTTNFGDYLNTWLWPQLFAHRVEKDDGVRLVGIGSLLKDTLSFVQGTKVIFGTGSGYGAVPARDTHRDWRFYFVRGPRTAELFQLSRTQSIVDGAWLIGLLPEFRHSRVERTGTAFVPHWTSADSGNWSAVCDQAGLKYVNPLGELHEILETLATSELVITESLHGAILADLFRTPWVPISMSPKFLPFKWVDWFESIELEPQMRQIPLSDLFDYVYSGVSPRRRDFRAAVHGIKVEAPKLERTASQRTPGRLYGLKIRIKSNLRDARRSVLSSCMKARDLFPMSVWNERHRESLAGTLRSIAGSRPLLSRDDVWRNRLDSLKTVTDRLKNDYDSGRLFGS